MLLRPLFTLSARLHLFVRTMSTNTKPQTNILNWASKDGEFRRQQSVFRDVIVDQPDAKFQPEKDRYHLYISWACPWAHRTAIVRALKGLDEFIGLSAVDYLMLDKGWKFSSSEECPGAIPDNINHASYLRDLYFKVNPNYEGRFTVPVLWDKKLNTIVNNESSEIIRMFNTAFNKFLSEDKKALTFYPEDLQKDIDEINDWIYNDINNGVYKSGFATTQEAYEKNVVPLFKSLDRVEEILSKNEFLVGKRFTEADIRLWTTIVRFDPVYHGHFKCNIKGIEKDYPHILKWARKIYQMPNVAGTVNLEHIKKHYYMSHRQINPTQVVPMGNGPDLSVPV
ncbi:glutathione S-transferase [Radiomyces spectabilis]|uniref:glutathione S-transferase n=1 Tax=Radiomyces spectabilis TaxID=64574 RepID=UPI00222074F7|nr:glutathione S-transferase [Radiomyces spectabilis]KAI8374680.1 glutathione S-transferase [Radiomyces spectabilis]